MIVLLVFRSNLFGALVSNSRCQLLQLLLNSEGSSPGPLDSVRCFQLRLENRRSVVGERVDELA